MPNAGVSGIQTRRIPRIKQRRTPFLDAIFSGLLSFSLSRTQTQDLVSSLRNANKKQAGAHGRRQRLNMPVNKPLMRGFRLGLPRSKGRAT